MSGYDKQNGVIFTGGAIPSGGASPAELNAVDQRVTALVPNAVVRVTGIGGTAQEITGSTQSIFSLVPGMRSRFIPIATNSGPDPVITVDGTPWILKRRGGAAMVAGDLVPGVEVDLFLSGTLGSGFARILSLRDFRPEDDNKLAGIQPGATANQTNAYLLARANQTGTQPISTVQGLQGALNGERDARIAGDKALQDQINQFGTGTRIVGEWSAADGDFPTERPSGSEIQNGDSWIVSEGGTVEGVTYGAGDILISLRAGGGTQSADWAKREGTATVAAQVSTDRAGVSVQDALDASPRYYVWDFYDPTDTGLQVAINRATDAAFAANGGCVIIERRAAFHTLTGKVILRTGVSLQGLGRPELRLANGVNTSLMESASFLDLTGTNSGAGESGLAVRGMVLDANRAGNTLSGHGLAFFGRDFIFEDLLIKRTRQRGLITEYGNTSVGVSPFNARVSKVTFDTTGEEAWVQQVSDLQGDNINVRTPGQNAGNTYDAIALLAGTRLTVGAIWRGGSDPAQHRYGIRTSGGSTVSSFNIETAATAAWRLDGDQNTVTDAWSYNNTGPAVVEIAGSNNMFRGLSTRGPIGEGAAAAVRFISGQNNVIEMKSSATTGPAVEFAEGYTGGYNKVEITGYRTAWTPIVGTPLANDEISVSLNVNGVMRDLKKSSVVFNQIVAAGTTQADATPLLRYISVVGGADGTKGVILPAAIEGMEMSVNNATLSSALNLYPATGQRHMGLVNNAPLVLSGGGGVRLIFNSGMWVRA